MFRFHLKFRFFLPEESQLGWWIIKPGVISRGFVFTLDFSFVSLFAPNLVFRVCFSLVCLPIGVVYCLFSIFVVFLFVSMLVCQVALSILHICLFVWMLHGLFPCWFAWVLLIHFCDCVFSCLFPYLVFVCLFFCLLASRLVFLLFYCEVVSRQTWSKSSNLWKTVLAKHNTITRHVCRLWETYKL